ncbi:hypothetical protein [Hamadaea tsunoensis]|uniref:hypothetical protein n=1 Tax=Hamadaea tsunoensis TaxID=53368 RepID=UPI000425DEA2|nr:hypothetical protein [Hamadaea tsunoensis]
MSRTIRWLMPLSLLAVLGGGAAAYAMPHGQPIRWTAGITTATGASPSPSAAPEPPPPPPPTLQAGPVTVTAPKDGFLAWAFYDRRTSTMSGSANSDSGVNSTESMIKAWMVSDYLRKRTKLTAAERKHVTGAIRDSNDNDADYFYKANGGKPGLKRLVTVCGLKHVKTSADPKETWAYTTMTAKDAVRMGLCIGDGRAAGPLWTQYVLDEMRHVEGDVTDNKIQSKTGGGHWGIIDALPDDVIPQTSIKNGWTMLWKDYHWHVDCLAVHPDWVLAVQVRTRYAPKTEKEAPLNADALCQAVTRQLVFPRIVPEPQPSATPTTSATPSPSASPPAP